MVLNNARAGCGRGRLPLGADTVAAPPPRRDKAKTNRAVPVNWGKTMTRKTSTMPGTGNGAGPASLPPRFPFLHCLMGLLPLALTALTSCGVSQTPTVSETQLEETSYRVGVVHTLTGEGASHATPVGLVGDIVRTWRPGRTLGSAAGMPFPWRVGGPYGVGRRKWDSGSRPVWLGSDSFCRSWCP